MVDSEEGGWGRPKEGGGHKPLKISLDAEIRNALDKVRKRTPVSQFIEDVIRPLARQFDPGPSSPIAKDILHKINSEREEAFKRADYEKTVALDFLLLRIKPVLDPFISMSEPGAGELQSERGEGGGGRKVTDASLRTGSASGGPFASEYTEARLGRLYHTLDYLTVQLESVFSQSRNIVDMKVVKVIRGPKYIDIGTALDDAGLTSGEFDLISYSQFAHDLKESKDVVVRVLSKKYPGWRKKIGRPPDARTNGLWLPDYLLFIDIDHTQVPYKANVVAHMARQFTMLEKNLLGAREMIKKLGRQFPELSDVVPLLDRYNAFFEPGFKKCREHMEGEKRMRAGIGECLAGRPHKNLPDSR